MKNRRPCGACSGCCRNCPYMKNKQAQPPGTMPETQHHSMPAILPPRAPEPLFVPVMAPVMLPAAAMEPPPPVPTTPAPAVTDESKVAVAPEAPAQTDDAAGTEAALADFLAQNPKKGQLRVQAFLGPQAIPVQGVKITLSRDFNGQPYPFFEGETDMSGIVDGIVLPAAPRDASLEPGQPQPSATYRLVAEHPDYETLDTTVDIYENIRTAQLVQLRPKTEV